MASSEITALGPPPMGIVSNYVDPPTLALQVHVGMGLTMTVTSVFVIMRFVAKMCSPQLWGWDDGENALRNIATVDLYAASAFFVKLSLFLLYLRLFKVNRATRYSIYIGIVLCAIFYSITLTVNTTLSVPSPSHYTILEAWGLQAEKSSVTMLQLAVSQSVFGTVSDIYLFVIPIQLIVKLNMTLQRKIGILTIFATGLL
ncbi:MAG: hypothetical protein Q9157_006058 [Trypethelium eluteriae]